MSLEENIARNNSFMEETLSQLVETIKSPVLNCGVCGANPVGLKDFRSILEVGVCLDCLQEDALYNTQESEEI